MKQSKNKPPAAATTMTERPFLQINDEDPSRHSFLEIALGAEDVTFSVTHIDVNERMHIQTVRVTPADFEALIERCRTHRFGGGL